MNVRELGAYLNTLDQDRGVLSIILSYEDATEFYPGVSEEDWQKAVVALDQTSTELQGREQLARIAGEHFDKKAVFERSKDKAPNELWPDVGSDLTLSLGEYSAVMKNQAARLSELLTTLARQSHPSVRISAATPRLEVLLDLLKNYAEDGYTTEDVEREYAPGTDSVYASHIAAEAIYNSLDDRGLAREVLEAVLPKLGALAAADVGVTLTGGAERNIDGSLSPEMVRAFEKLTEAERE